jgi:hypothetical protein
MTVSTRERIDQVKPVSTSAPLRSWWQSFFAFVLYLIVAIAVLEGYFRIAGIGQQEFLQPDLIIGCHHIPGKVVTWRLEGYSCDRFNADGLRDSEHNLVKPPGVFRIALLGDSATESMQVNMNETYGKVLEAMLNERYATKPFFSAGKPFNKFEVINFGCSSYSTGQELFEYKHHVLKYHPDAVVVLFNRGDTAENCLNLKAKDSPEPRPYFFLGQSGSVQTDDTVLQANYDKLAPNPPLDFLRANSRIYGVFSQANLSLSLTDSRFRKFRSWLDRTTAMFSGKPLLRTTSLTYPQQDELQVTSTLVKTFASQVKENGQSFILLIFPNMGHDPYFAKQTDMLSQMARKDGFGYLDLTAKFVDSKRPTDNFLWYHFSPTGHRLVAEQLFVLISNNKQD